jgi:hypothetical protein
LVFRVSGFGFRVSGFRFRGVGFRVSGLGAVMGAPTRVQPAAGSLPAAVVAPAEEGGFGVWGLVFQVSGLGARVRGLGVPKTGLLAACSPPAAVVAPGKGQEERVRVPRVCVIPCPSFLARSEGLWWRLGPTTALPAGCSLLAAVVAPEKRGWGTGFSCSSGLGFGFDELAQAWRLNPRGTTGLRF